jgi:hypothetical protein
MKKEQDHKEGLIRVGMGILTLLVGGGALFLKIIGRLCNCF